MLQKNKEHLSRAGDAVGSFIAAPVDSLVETITLGKTPVIRQRTRSLISELFKSPFRIAGTTAWGLVKGIGGLGLKAALRAPILPLSPVELRQIVRNETRDKLDAFNRLMHKNLLADESAIERLSTAV